LGALPAAGQGKTVASRLDSIETKIASMSEKIKLNREIFIGYAIAGTLIKFDIQAIKIDLTLLKKIDEKNVALLKRPIAALQKGFTALTSKGEGSVYQKLKDQIFKEQARKRKEEQEEEKRKEREKEEAEKRFQKELRDLPKKVDGNTKDIDKILRTLRGAGAGAQAARDDRTGLAHNHKGVDAKQPRVGPVAKDVKNLRSAVDELITSLGSL